MENATKALIIAGAILVAILLVTMGVALLSNTDGLTGSSNSKLSQLELEEFNGQIVNGVGTNVSGTNVITMLKNVQAKIRDKGDIGLVLDCDITGCKVTTNKEEDLIKDIENMINHVRTTKRYKVDPTKDDNSGYYTKLVIREKTTTTP